jgi:hypothetical protein
MSFQIVALVLVAGLALAGTAMAKTAVITVDGQVGGKEKPKFEKKKFKGTGIVVNTTTADADDPAGLPPKVHTSVVKFDKKNIRFDSDAVPGCDPAQIAGATTEGAIAACPDAVTGDGLAVVNLPFGVGGTRQDFDAVVTGFNRLDEPGILLHSRVSALQTTTLLTSVLKGSTLTVTVPPIAGGAGASSVFNTSVKAGKYVQARCKSKKIKYKETFSFTDAPDATASDIQKCRQKKGK